MAATIKKTTTDRNNNKKTNIFTNFAVEKVVVVAAIEALEIPVEFRLLRRLRLRRRLRLSLLLSTGSGFNVSHHP